MHDIKSALVQNKDRNPPACGIGWNIAGTAFLARTNAGDAKMYQMAKASVGDLRYRFAEVEGMLREGEEIQITKRKRVIATLVPAERRPTSAEA